ncbi:DUF3606 domain-containing protein [Sphingobium sufflavum]|uniref:DUF3606 domain-containing protein n=1 Tax=Sphingobium sufflavum TaxID=1129547 RepID=UPI001F45B6A3|nr:DUF3606 domain-containing protein [Sphingobium sufflavum]MCE7798705.1 DUF3606 domain-containing protein [Sphingobium sufflavum]
MADDKANTGSQDRAQVAGAETYEVSYFAQKHGISADEARDLIAKHGNDRKTLDAAAESMLGKKT